MAWAVFVPLESVFWVKMFSKCQIQSCLGIMAWAVFVPLESVLDQMFSVSNPILFLDYDMGSVCAA